MRKHRRISVWLAFAVLSGGLAITAHPALAAQKGDIFASLASGLRKAVSTSLPDMEACAADKKLRAGIMPFDPARAPLPEVALRRIYNDMLARLTANPPDCMEFLDARSMRAILRHLQQTGAYDRKGMTAIRALRDASANVDLLLAGQITAAAGRFYLDYRLIERKTGKLLARLKARELPASYVDVTSADAALPVKEAMEAAAEELLAQAAPMKALAVEGIYFQDTRLETSGSRFMRDKLRDRLVRAYANKVTGKALRLVKDVKEGDESAYRLSGRYRIMGGDAVDLSVTMTNGSGMAASWSGLVRITGLEGLRWRPENEQSVAAADGANSATANHPSATFPSAFGFELLTDHGASAYYAPGEAVRLKMRLERSAYVYCYFTGERGETAAIIPNPRWIAKSGRKSLRVRKYVMFTLPDPARDGFVLRVNPRAAGGKMPVRCYAASRDVTGELPPQLRGARDGLVPADMAARLDDIFTALKGVALAKAQTDITISRGKK